MEGFKVEAIWVGYVTGQNRSFLCVDQNALGRERPTHKDYKNLTFFIWSRLWGLHAFEYASYHFQLIQLILSFPFLVKTFSFNPLTR